MSKEEDIRPMLPKDESWFAQWGNFALEYLNNNFSLIDKNIAIPGKSIRGRKPIIKLNLDKFPAFATQNTFEYPKRIISLSIRLDNIQIEETDQLIGTSIKRNIVYLANLGGEFVYDDMDQLFLTKKKRSMKMGPGEILSVTNIPELHYFLASAIPIFKLRRIDPKRQTVTIGPI